MEPVKVNQKGAATESLILGEIKIEFPTGKGIPYLWIGTDKLFIGTIDSKRELRKLQRMVGRVLENL